MECKVVCVRPGRPYDKIGIYPEWNVKSLLRLQESPFAFIGIYPEWNVKIISLKMLFKLLLIGIYPEWNVKSKGA